MPKIETVADMRALALEMVQMLRTVLGPRSSVVIMIGAPIEGQDHDRFAASITGPCLSARGLLSWGEKSCLAQIAAGDTSMNGKDHP